MQLSQYPRYESYKPSGVEWLGDVPDGWQVSPGRACLYENKDKNTGMKESTVLSLSYGNVIVKPEEKLTGLVPESFETYQIVEPGDIIIRGTDLQNDVTSLQTGLAKDRGIITSAYVNLRPHDNVLPFYLHYVLHSYDVKKVFYGLGSGLRQNLSYEDFKYLDLPLPDIATQERIVAFLDDKTDKIDRAVKIKEGQIALLRERKQIIIQEAVTKGLNPDTPMKDSGIDGLGKVPSHWEIVFNRRLFRENSRKILQEETPLSLSQVDGVIPSEDMKERSLSPSHRNNFKLCLPDDLVVNRFKGHLGVFFRSPYRGIVTFHYGVFEPGKSVATKYYELLYHTECYKTIYAGASNGMTIGLQNLSNLNFYRIKSPRPPQHEQVEIIDFVAERSKDFDEAISLKEKQIAKLNEYKATLINAAVTGKIKVI